MAEPVLASFAADGTKPRVDRALSDLAPKPVIRDLPVLKFAASPTPANSASDISPPWSQRPTGRRDGEALRCSQANHARSRDVETADAATATSRDLGRKTNWRASENKRSEEH